MAVFRMKGTKAEQIRPTQEHAREKHIQSLIEGNLETIFGVRFLATEFSTGTKHRGRIDTLGLDEDGSPVIIEYKRTASDNIINQGLFYLDWLMDHRGDFEIAARKAVGDKVEISWSAPRLMLVAQSFSRYDQYAVNRIDDRIELYEFRFYDDGLLTVERLDSDEVPTTKTKPDTTPKPKRRGTKARTPSYDLAHHTSKMSASTLPLFERLEEEILALGDDVTERFMNQYVGYRRLKNFVEIVGLRSKLNLFIDGPVSDTNGIGEDVSGIGHWGTGDLRIAVETDEDVDAVMPLIRQAYELQQ